MNTQELINTAGALVANDKGLLAMDESNPTCNKRFAKQGIPQTEEARRSYRELIITTPLLGECISGTILYDETIRQRKKDGTPFIRAIIDAGIIPGIKVDTGAKDLAGHPREKITEGLDGLRDRLKEYFQMGARFAKWRAVITVGDCIPSQGCVEANAQALARYAALCQEAGLVPVVEPEVLMEGDHSMERCRELTEEVLRAVFAQLYVQRVTLEGMLLKPNMVLPGLLCAEQEAVDDRADATIGSLLRVVPAAVPGVAFLSGGQSCELASARLNAMNVRFKRICRGRWRFRLPARFSNRPLSCGKARKQTWRWRSRLFITAPGATARRAVASIMPPWKRRGSGTRSRQLDRGAREWMHQITPNAAFRRGCPPRSLSAARVSPLFSEDHSPAWHGRCRYQSNRED
jgi:fructose-bisphosphate aldolase class I